MRRVFPIIFIFAALSMVFAVIRHGRPKAVAIPALEPAGNALGDGSFRQDGVYVSTPDRMLPARLGNRGSWLGTDEFKGAHETGWYRARSRVIIMVAGYPNHPGNRLELEVRESSGAVKVIRFSGADSHESWLPWDLTLPFRAEAFRIRAVDDAIDGGGWVAFSEPFQWQGLIERQLWAMVQLGAFTCLAMTLLYGPGLLWLMKPGVTPVRIAVAALIGPLCLVGIGLLCWIFGGLFSPVLIARSAIGVMLAYLGWRGWREHRELALPGRFGAVLAATALLVSFAVAKANFSNAAEGELYRNSISRTLEVGGHSDSRISYHVVQVVGNHLAPFSPQANAYFDPWSFASRGPISGILAAPLVLASGAQIPLIHPDHPWEPFDVQGFAVYRIALIVLASLAAWSMFALLSGVLNPAWGLLGAMVMLLTPFFVHEMYFTWPKLFTAGTVLTSFLLAHEGRRFSAGIALGLAYLVHPLALLSTPFIGIWMLGRAWKTNSWPRRLLAPIVFGAGLAVMIVFWQGVSFTQPGGGSSQSSFLTYFRMADNQWANAASWRESRWQNFANTFIPFYLFKADPNHASLNSYYNPSGPWVRAGFLYWNTLPFALGLPVFVWLMLSILRGCRRHPWICAVTLFAPTLFLIAYWGAADTGLMRHCGHVLFVSTIALGVWTLHRDRPEWRQRLTGVLLHPAFLTWRVVEMLVMAFGTTFLLRVPRWDERYGINDWGSFAICVLCVTAATFILTKALRAALPELLECSGKAGRI